MADGMGGDNPPGIHTSLRTYRPPQPPAGAAEGAAHRLGQVIRRGAKQAPELVAQGFAHLPRFSGSDTFTKLNK